LPRIALHADFAMKMYVRNRHWLRSDVSAVDRHGEFLLRQEASTGDWHSGVRLWRRNVRLRSTVQLFVTEYGWKVS